MNEDSYLPDSLSTSFERFCMKHYIPKSKHFPVSVKTQHLIAVLSIYYFLSWDFLFMVTFLFHLQGAILGNPEVVTHWSFLPLNHHVVLETQVLVQDNMQARKYTHCESCACHSSPKARLFSLIEAKKLSWEGSTCSLFGRLNMFINMDILTSKRNTF